MTVFQSLVMGAVQGVTEFLPISSHAHLILVPWAFGWKDPGLAYDVFLHLGTLIAIFVYFFKDWFVLAKAGLQSILERKVGYDKDRLLFWLLVLGTLPGVGAGLLFGDAAEAYFRSPLLIAISLAGVGFLLYWVDGKYATLKSVEELRPVDALWIGVAQAVAIIPGVSRSGSTMGMGRLRGLSRESAARFSFLLSFPITLGAFLFEFRHFTEKTILDLPRASLITGFVTSLVFGFLTIHFLLQYLRNADFRVFAWYRLLVAIAIVVASAWGTLR